MLTYFFLSGFVLLSKSQNFAHPFIRAHAKYAFLFHAAVVVLIASLVFTRTLYDLDVLGISLKHIVYTALFIGCLAGMIHGMYRASR